jgi:alanine dehydrogenase
VSIASAQPEPDTRRVETTSHTIGLPAEVKDGERRVALDPPGVRLLVAAGLEVRVQAGAGTGAGFADTEYKEAGAVVVPDADEAWAVDLVVKVKEPQPDEWRFFRPGLRLFGYLHLAAEPTLAAALADAEVEAHAFETVSDARGLPLLAPMSEIAGRVAAIVGAFHLAGGSGTLLGGGAGVPPARVVVIGMGVAGTMAARGARGMDAEVTGVDVDLGRLYEVSQAGIVTGTLASVPELVGEAVRNADLVVGAALVPGARAPVVVAEEHVAAMRPGSVVVDLAIDQGGCVATARPTSLSEPTYTHEGVVHYCVTNVPGQYPRTASRALSAAVAPRACRLALDPAHPSLEGSLNVARGAVVHPTVAAALAS